MNGYLLVGVWLLVSTFAVNVGSAGAIEKADPNGTWKWTFTPPGQDGIEVSAELKLDGQRLTGQVTAGERSFDISDGAFVDNEVAFNVVADNDGSKVTARFKGKVEGDSITGKTEVDFNGQALSFEWNATRQK